MMTSTHKYFEYVVVNTSPYRPDETARVVPFPSRPSAEEHLRLVNPYLKGWQRAEVRPASW